MSKTIYPQYDKIERLRLLEANADRVEAGKYIKPLDPEEIYMRREQLSDESIKLRGLLEEKKEAMDAFKQRIQPVQETVNRLIDEIKFGQVELDGRLFLMAEHDMGMMEYYDENGELIKSRRLFPDERQATVFNISGKSAAANDR